MGMNEREAAYKKAGWGASSGFGNRPALVVVDFQKGFTIPESPLGSNMDFEVANTKKLADACRKKNIKIVYCRLGYNKDGSDMTTWQFKIPSLKEYTRDHLYYEYDERLGIQENDMLLEKHGPSAFFGTYLTSTFTALRIDTVMVAGCTVGGCVYATVVDAMSHGYRPVIVTDCCADRSKEVKDMFMWNMGQKYGELMASDEIIDHIETFEPLAYEMLY